MPRRKPGLPAGRKSLSERIAEGMAEIDAQREKTRQTMAGKSVPGGAEVEVDEGGRRRAVIDERTGREQSREDAPIFSTVHVAQVANKPDDPRNYGQGPSASTRLCSHKFVVDQPMMDLYGAKMGYALVRFHKSGSRGTDWVYGPMDVAVYEAFARSNSKGHFINTTLNGYGYRPASDTPYGAEFADFSTPSGTDAAGIRL